MLQTALITIALFLLLWWTVLYLMQDSMLFPAHMTGPPLTDPPWSNCVVFEHTIGADDEAGGVSGARGEAWLALASGASAQSPGPVVVFCHGNAELVDYLNDIVFRYRQMGVSVLLPEYRGYGRNASAGRPSQVRIRTDLTAFYDLMLERPEIDPKRVFFHGRSVGAAVAADLATQRKPSALIMQSAFTSVPEMATRYFAPPVLVKHPYRSNDALRKVATPVMLTHGTYDRIVPVSHGRKLAKLTGTELLEYPCGHNDFPGFDNTDDYWERIEAFLRKEGVLE